MHVLTLHIGKKENLYHLHLQLSWLLNFHHLNYFVDWTLHLRYQKRFDSPRIKANHVHLKYNVNVTLD